MHVHYLQHVPFEGPAGIEQWAIDSGNTIDGSHLYRGDSLPKPDSFDILVILGGPMSVNDEADYAWLQEEKHLVRASVEAGRSILGVCLGAQIIANALGARVYRAAEKEIGWFPIRKSTNEGIATFLPGEFTPLHWHGETFDLPTGAIRIAETDRVPNQAFQIGRRIIGLQFHLEATPESVRMLISNAADEIQPGREFQQTSEVIINRTVMASAKIQPLLRIVLDYLAI